MAYVLCGILFCTHVAYVSFKGLFHALFVGLCGLCHAFAIPCLCNLDACLLVVQCHALLLQVHHSCALVGLFLDAYTFYALVE